MGKTPPGVKVARKAGLLYRPAMNDRSHHQVAFPGVRFMRRLLILLLLAACLMPEAGPVQAQATTDQLNKLSLEALTTPAPGGNPGPSYRSRSYRGSGTHRSGYVRSGYRRARHYGTARRGQGDRRSAYHHRSYHGGSHRVSRSRHAASSGDRRHGARHAAYHRRHSARRRATGYQQGGYAPSPYTLRHGH